MLRQDSVHFDALVTEKNARRAGREASSCRFASLGIPTGAWAQMNHNMRCLRRKDSSRQLVEIVTFWAIQSQLHVGNFWHLS